MSSTGNGADIGQVLAIVRSLAEGQQSFAEGQREMRAILESHSRMLESHSRILESHSRKLDDLSADMDSMRHQLTEYHSSVLGHGVMISELEERVRRIERHLKLPPAAE